MHVPGRAMSHRSLGSRIRSHASNIPGQQQAVVLGSGMGGLAAAKVLSKYFNNVTVVEKDNVPDILPLSPMEVIEAKGARRGVTQYNQLHALVARGLKAYDEIFEGQYSTALEAAGGNLVNMFSSLTYIHPSGGPWLHHNNFKEPVVAACCTRHQLESTARQLLTAAANVTFMYGTAATGLTFADQAGANNMHKAHQPAVTGVTLADGSVLPADLVVDCCGRHSSLPDWLAAAGFEPPRVATATANCGYAGFFVQLAPDVEAALSGQFGYYIMADAPETSLAILIRVEGGAWMCCLGGQEGNVPSTKDEELLEFAKRVWHPAAGRVLQDARLLAPATRFYRVRTTWRLYDQVNLPEGLVPIADSICSFNPIYGQGMTVAAMQAELLDKLLARRAQHAPASAVAAAGGEDHKGTQGVEDSSCTSSSSNWLLGLSTEAQRAFAPTIQAAWDMAVGTDLKYGSAVTSEPRRDGVLDRLLQGYVASVFQLAATDELANEVTIRVLHMLDGPEAMLQPALVGRVLWHHLTAPLSGLNPQHNSSSKSGGNSWLQRLQVEGHYGSSSNSGSGTAGNSRSAVGAMQGGATR